MGYGLGVSLAVGLILAFAVQDAISGVDLTMVGYILAGVGVLAIVVTATHPQPVTGVLHGSHDDALGRHRDHHGAQQRGRSLIPSSRRVASLSEDVRPRPGRLARVGVAVAVGGAVFATAGCSSSPTNGVSAASQGFYSAVADGDGTKACALLSAATRTELEQSTEKSCPEALLEEDLPEPDRGGASTRAYGTMAIVTSAGDTMFLSRFPDGWLVTAVGAG